MPESIGEIILAILLVLISAFFSMAETSLTSLGKFKIRTMVEENKKGADHIEKVTKDKDRLLGSILIGANFANIALGSLATAFTISLVGGSGTSIMIATVISTLIIVIFGELMPKTIALKTPEKIALLVVKPLRLMMIALSPIAIALNKIIFLILSPLGYFSSEHENSITENELKTILDVGLEEGVIESDEHKMIDKVMDFEDVHAKDIMTPRTDMVVINVEFSYSKVQEVFSTARLSRLPVYKEDIDNIVGVLHIKDFICANSELFSVSNYMREPYFTLEQKHAREIFNEMRKENSSLAIVLDEYGGTAGLFSIEDIIEEIVGEIFDEHDDVLRNETREINSNEFLLNGTMKIDDFNEFSKREPLESEEYESIGGYVMGLAGGIPSAGTEIISGNITFVAEEIKRNRIERLRVKFTESVAEEELLELEENG